MKLIHVEKKFEDTKLEDCDAQRIAHECKSLSEKILNKDSVFIGIYRIKSEIISMIVSLDVQQIDKLEKYCSDFLSSLNVDNKNLSFDEMTCAEFADCYKYGDTRRLLPDKVPHYLKSIKNVGLDSYHKSNIEECLFPVLKKKEYQEECERILFQDALMPEINRIYSSKTKEYYGNPVHYLIKGDDFSYCSKAFEILLSALYDNNRIIQKRYFIYDYDFDEGLNKEYLEEVFKASKGGAIVIRIANPQIRTNFMEGRYCEMALMISDLIIKYRKDVLAIIAYISNESDNINFLLENLDNLSVVELNQLLIVYESALDYFKYLCRINKIRIDSKLTDRIKKGDVFKKENLDKMFDSWYENKLKSKIYPEYKDVKKIEKKVIEEAPKGDSYSELMNLVGLSSAKQVVDDLINYSKAAKIYKNKGIKFDMPNLSMVFTGNPGTAKTTVARLFASILRDNQILPRGQFIEVGRQDLIGKYVGWTANIVKDKFRAAKGGCLFIDEAYSLIDGKTGYYGDEAINTIVQEMENNREDTFVIFAGYPNEMENFINRNPGLNSRISYKVSFDDYSISELCEISKLIAKQKGYEISEKALEKLENIYEVAIKQKDYGNGRYVRNCIEKAILKHGCKLLKHDSSDISDLDCITIDEDDIDYPSEFFMKPKTLKAIGFSA